MKDFTKQFSKNIFKLPYISALITVIIILISIQSYTLGEKSFDGTRLYTHYNNYVIFKNSFTHLVDNKDLYKLYPQEHWDYYKYSPTFSLFMAIFAFLPVLPGLILWNLLNALVLLIAVWKLPVPGGKTKTFILLFLLIELVTSVQNAQSNALIAGLIILSFVNMQEKRLWLSSLLIVITVYIKLFGIVALILFIFYPGKTKAALYTLGWTALFFLLPLTVIPFHRLVFLYKSWFNLIFADINASYGLSVAGWLNSWFYTGIPKNAILLAGTILLLIPLLKTKYYHHTGFKILYLSFLLIWIVIFNYKAESPTYVIAVTGVAIWFFTGKMSATNTALALSVLIFTILSPTDIFPRYVKHNFIIPYVLKAVPCIFVWFKIFYELLLYGNKTR